MVKQETPDPTGIEALTEVVGFVQAMAPHEEHSVWDALDIAEAALRSQSRALAEREETIGRLRLALKPFAEAHENASNPRDYTSRSAFRRAAEALASAPKGEGKG